MSLIDGFKNALFMNNSSVDKQKKEVSPNEINGRKVKLSDYKGKRIQPPQAYIDKINIANHIIQSGSPTPNSINAKSTLTTTIMHSAQKAIHIIKQQSFINRGARSLDESLQTFDKRLSTVKEKLNKIKNSVTNTIEKRLSSRPQNTTSRRSTRKTSGKITAVFDEAERLANHNLLPAKADTNGKTLDKEKVLADSEQIIKELGNNLPRLMKKAAKAGGAIKLSKRNNKALPHSITITSEGKVFMHCKYQLGKGSEKTIKMSIDVFSGSLAARSSGAINGETEWTKVEPHFFKKFTNTPGIAQATTYDYTSAKTGQDKVGLAMKTYNAGGIDSLFSVSAFRDNRKVQRQALLGMANGVNAMHQQKCIHGDIKPQNLLANFDPHNPEEIEVGLSDFGNSADLNETQPQELQSLIAGGTPGFTAPEIGKDFISAGLEGKDLEDHLIGEDLYAFGVSVYSILTGAHDEATLTSFRQNNWKNYTTEDIEKFVKPLRGDSAISEEIVDLLVRSLDKDAKVRPQIAEWIPHLENAVGVSSTANMS